MKLNPKWEIDSNQDLKKAIESLSEVEITKIIVEAIMDSPILEIDFSLLSPC